MTDGVFGSGAGQVRITGLSKTMRALTRAGADAQDMRELMHSIGMLVVNRASAPVKTGRLASTLRAGKGKTKAVVRVGGARVPYAGAIHFGWPARGIRPQPFLTTAEQQSRPAVYARLDQGIEELLRKNGLL